MAWSLFGRSARGGLIAGRARRRVPGWCPGLVDRPWGGVRGLSCVRILSALWAQTSPAKAARETTTPRRWRGEVMLPGSNVLGIARAGDGARTHDSHVGNEADSQRKSLSDRTCG